jgi:hypothetical protein
MYGYVSYEVIMELPGPAAPPPATVTLLGVPLRRFLRR